MEPRARPSSSAQGSSISAPVPQMAPPPLSTHGVPSISRPTHSGRRPTEDGGLSPPPANTSLRNPFSRGGRQNRRPRNHTSREDMVQ
ncbi:hypothetical protein LshimejAT787_3700030 [Lyophyllum shimeji]|uniref:Uncharacterized protein n=1 Tax=Lyophyllum shimeji TaxID=47721 RepID=A0A9P3UV35_LYOSH|nr:hypothetical protein LshimejAT787_2200930 [Lyophyllum shimeji]GLB45873.1 hypothetical protein LshimejAT787_3500010 [Lyophyllum shimeji]GLB45900.1 hypothetical protein LshimejAT787_3700030 [Lyophyllum shimeji]